MGACKSLDMRTLSLINNPISWSSAFLLSAVHIATCPGVICALPIPVLTNNPRHHPQPLSDLPNSSSPRPPTRVGQRSELSLQLLHEVQQI